MFAKSLVSKGPSPMLESTWRRVRAAVVLLATLLSVIGSVPGLALAQPLIVIDAGHGGMDPGAVGCSLEEADVVLDVSMRLATLLEARGLRTALTRSDDTFVQLTGRATFANSRAATGFVSIHSNSNDGTPATGTETFIANSAGARSLDLATRMQTAMIATWMLRDRMVKRANFTVLTATDMPAALAELGFTNNCAVDAMLLASATSRQSIAVALADAIVGWTGVGPVADGTLRGVVFEDQGVGLDDLSVLLPGASVRVVENGMTATAAAGDATWSFTLPPGMYTVEASASGHVTNRRSCMVTSSAETYCSVGLFPEGGAGTDAGSVSIDAATSPRDAGSSLRDASSVAVDAFSFDTGASDDEDAATQIPVRPDAGGGGGGDGGCGCRAAGGARSSGLGALGGLFVVMTWLRRRRDRRARVDAAPLGRVASAVVATVVLGAGCATETTPAAASLETAAPRGTTTPSEAPAFVVTAPFLRVLASTAAPLVRPSRQWATASISPTGRALALTATDLGALDRIELPSLTDGALASFSLAAATSTEVCIRARCGFEPRWQSEDALAVRSPEQSDTAIPVEAFDREGHAVPVTVRSPVGHVLVDDGDRIVWIPAGGPRVIVTTARDRYMSPRLSPDGRFLVYWGLHTGLTLHRVEGATLGPAIALGEGGHPSFDPSASVLLFDRTTDEGHRLESGELLALDLRSEPMHLAPIADPIDAIEVAPTMSMPNAEGHARLAFVRDETFVVADVVLAR